MKTIHDKLVPIMLSQLRKRPRLVSRLSSFARKVSPDTVVLLDYPLKPLQRWHIPPYNPFLYDIINQHRDLYKSVLNSFLPLTDHFSRIPAREPIPFKSTEPYWINGWMPGLDGVALYGFMVANNPKLYVEVGSGISTKFARKAIANHNLRTMIVSIDPHPRAEIDELCDKVIREPLEEADLRIFDGLEQSDIVYIDGSHQTFMNSDVTVFFLEVMPKLKPGVLIEIHDIFLPYDYPEEWADRYYSEQYLLAVCLLAKGSTFDIVLPSIFISKDEELSRVLAPLWKRNEMMDVETHGCSFWIQMR
jgi:Methyltransferase domain